MFAAKIHTSEGQISHSYRRELCMEKLVTATNMQYAGTNQLQLQTCTMQGQTSYSYERALLRD